ncbi:hypothetical protein [Alicyclobacillus sendaiensis]|uniref:hypothetical protein n=1 Tax=Alicyclobacillus sendaiensis TaxID=192387 RepID=UPI0026F41421|nr:hypothetical protein [Alicyclobacillus sendaiensis]
MISRRMSMVMISLALVNSLATGCGANMTFHVSMNTGMGHKGTTSSSVVTPNASNSTGLKIKSFAWFPSGTCWLVTNQGLLFSRDSGITWYNVLKNPTALNGVQYFLGDDAWIFSKSILYRFHGMQLSHPSLTNLSMQKANDPICDFVNSKEGFYLETTERSMQGDKLLLFKTDNGGFAWKLISSSSYPPNGELPFTSDLIEHITFISDHAGFLYGMSPVEGTLDVYESTDEVHWSLKHVVVPSSYTQDLVMPYAMITNNTYIYLPVVAIPTTPSPSQNTGAFILYRVKRSSPFGSWQLVAQLSFSPASDTYMTANSINRVCAVSQDGDCVVVTPNGVWMRQLEEHHSQWKQLSNKFDIYNTVEIEFGKADILFILTNQGLLYHLTGPGNRWTLVSIRTAHFNTSPLQNRETLCGKGFSSTKKDFTPT